MRSWNRCATKLRILFFQMLFGSLQQTAVLPAPAADLPGEVRNMDGVLGPNGRESGSGDFWELPEFDGAAKSS